MSDDHPHPRRGASRSWWEKFSQLFTGEPQNRDQLIDVIAEAQERALIDPTTSDMIKGVLDVAEMRVRDIMIPRSQIVALEIDQPVDEFLPILIETKHSRYPVVNEDKDHVEGILLAKDLLEALYHNPQQIDLRDYLRPAVIVPESKKVDSLLKEFRDNRYHMAIVVDEYGGVSGLVTIEDILEIIVGEIEDEHDDEETDIKPIGKSTYLVKALTELEDFNDYFGSQLDEDIADTIGGYVLHGFGHMPDIGETLTTDGFVFKVTMADSRRIHQLQVSRQGSDKQADES